MTPKEIIEKYEHVDATVVNNVVTVTGYIWDLVAWKPTVAMIEVCENHHEACVLQRMCITHGERHAVQI